MSDPNQPGDLSNINPREERIYKAVELLAKAAQVAEKNYLRDQCRLHILELLEPRGDCEHSVEMLLRTQLSFLELDGGGEDYDRLKQVQDALKGD